MRFYDPDAYEIVTLKTLRDEFDALKADQPDEYGFSFAAYIADVTRATISGRNDMDVIGLTPNEIGRIINRIEKRGA